VACNTIVHHRLTHSRRLYPAGVWLTVRSDPEPTAWLEALVNGSGVLSRFLRFRAESVARLVAELAEEARRLGRKVSLDLFSPCLAPLVGQSYQRLKRLCGVPTPVRSLRISFRAACLLRLDWTSTSRTSASTARLV
jgi:hypothetical protein